jgi:hypothetical protein
VIIGRRLAGFSHLGLRGRSAGRSKYVSCLPEAAGRVAQLRVPRWPAGRRCHRRVAALVPRRKRPHLGRRPLRCSGLDRPRLAARLAACRSCPVKHEPND